MFTTARSVNLRVFSPSFDSHLTISSDFNVVLLSYMCLLTSFRITIKVIINNNVSRCHPLPLAFCGWMETCLHPTQFTSLPGLAQWDSLWVIHPENDTTTGSDCQEQKACFNIHLSDGSNITDWLTSNSTATLGERDTEYTMQPITPSNLGLESEY